MRRYSRKVSAYPGSPGGSNVAYYIKDLEEATTATGVDADIKTIPVNIPVTASFRVAFSFRKTAGAANAPTLGLKINATQVFVNTAMFSAVNQAENGSLSTESMVTARSAATYLRPGTLVYQNWIGVVSGGVPAGVDFPNATITSLVITGSSVSPLITLAVANVIVEVFL